ncbi:hypothetical protein [Anoxybacillus sp. KU2-6(11)]|uniref:hypothetical protein n=1 Tax=Anoxybacillus sp. KU2-6(11) TaxID=1535751 RepID=UPI000ABA6D31|nr:hypothetical protein [Anoxybacillus sp. KU2-6(11)]
MKKWLVLILVFFLMSCAHEQKEQQQSLQQENITNVSHDGSAKRGDQQHAEKAVQMLKERQDVKDAVAVEANGRLLVAYQVKHLHRFRMKQIEKEVGKALNEQFREKVIASHDLKNFLENESVKRKNRNEKY